MQRRQDGIGGGWRSLKGRWYVIVDDKSYRHASDEIRNRS